MKKTTWGKNRWIREQLISYKNVYFVDTAKQEVIDKIRHKYQGISNLQIYIDGNTMLRKCVRGIVIDEKSIYICDDLGDITCFREDVLGDISLLYTNQCIIINGKKVTLGAVSKKLYECLLFISNEIKQEKIFGTDIKEMQLGEIEWYIGYLGNVYGGFTKEEIVNYIEVNEFDFSIVLVWNPKMKNWMLISECMQFEIRWGKREKKKVKEKTDDAISVVDINSCSAEQLLELEGFSKHKVDEFMVKRENGYYLKNIYEIQREFLLLPHQLEKVRSKIFFGVKERSRIGRKIDY